MADEKEGDSLENTFTNPANEENVSKSEKDLENKNSVEVSFG